MRSPILDQYHARVKHKEPFSRCGPLWRSLFWRQPWQGPQGWLSLPCDTDCPADHGGSLSCAGGGRTDPGRAGMQPGATCEKPRCGAPGAGLPPPRPRDRARPARSLPAPGLNKQRWRFQRERSGGNPSGNPGFSKPRWKELARSPIQSPGGAFNLYEPRFVWFKTCGLSFSVISYS